VQRAKEAGEFDEGVVDLRGENIEVVKNFPTTIIKDSVRRPFHLSCDF